MDNKDETAFAELLAACAEIFDKNISATGTELYFQALKEFSIEDLKGAIGKIIATRTYASMPKPGEIREAIMGKEGDQGMIAWQKVDEAIRKHGAYDTVVFDDPKIPVVIDLMGGWVQVAHADNEAHKWNGINFQKHYAAVKSPRTNRILPGVHDQHNIAKGFPEQKVVQIGERKPLKQIQGGK